MITMSFRAEADVKKELEQWADTNRCSQADIIKEALQQYFEHQRWMTETISRRLEAISPDKFLDHADVVKRFAERD